MRLTNVNTLFFKNVVTAILKVFSNCTECCENPQEGQTESVWTGQDGSREM